MLQRPAPSAEDLAEWVQVINNWRKQMKYTTIKKYLKNLMTNQIPRQAAYLDAFKAHTQGAFK